MTFDLMPARPWMAHAIELQDAQALSGQAMSPESINMAIEGGMALAAASGGKIVAMAGVFERWEGCGLAWALLSRDFARHRFSGFKVMKRALDTSVYNRVEAHVVAGHDEGARLLDHLGFVREGTMRKFWQGRDHHLYAKVR